MPKVNKTQYAILGVLRDGPASGYDIKKFCDLSIAHFWRENYGHIYPVLARMEKAGLICKQDAAPVGRGRNEYTITEKGIEALRSWLLLPSEPVSQRKEFFLKLFFSADIAVEHTVHAIEKEMAAAREHTERYRAIERYILADEAMCRDRNYPFRMATLHYGIAMSQAKTAWCTETLKTLSSTKPVSRKPGRSRK